jgi:hypothetical protein
MIDDFSLYERSINFLRIEADHSTRLKTLLFIRGELNRVNENSEIKQIKDLVNGLIDTIVDH